MSKILIVYGSSTGNTANIADRIKEKLQADGNDVTVLNAADAEAKDLALPYDAVLFGASAWGEDNIEMQDDFAALFEDVAKMGLKGKKAAAFASGDPSYPHFCGAVDIIEPKAQEAGAEIIASALRLEGDGTDSADDIAAYVAEVEKNL